MEAHPFNLESGEVEDCHKLEARVREMAQLLKLSLTNKINLRISWTTQLQFCASKRDPDSETMTKTNTQT